MVDFEFSTVFARWKHFATFCEHENEKLVSMALQKGEQEVWFCLSAGCMDLALLGLYG